MRRQGRGATWERSKRARPLRPTRRPCSISSALREVGQYQRLLQKLKSPTPRSEASFVSAEKTGTKQLFLVHVAHAAAVSAWSRGFLLFRNLRNECFGGEHQ